MFRSNATWPAHLCEGKQANDVVHYLLVADQRKFPVKKADINKIVLRENRKSFAAVMKTVKEILDNVFGIQLIDLSEKKAYILVNKLSIDDENPHIVKRRQFKDWAVVCHFGFDIHVWKHPRRKITRIESFYGILSITKSQTGTLEKAFHLQIIGCPLYQVEKFKYLRVKFTNEGQLEVELYARIGVLWLTLKKMGIDVSSVEPHAVFGDIKKLVTGEFVKQAYLEYNRIEGKEPPVYEFKWGPRAAHETSKHDILNFVCQIYQDKEMKQFQSQYEDALRSEENSAA